MRFELFIASRYLRAKRRQAFIGVITAISIAGVAAGVASLIIALAINNGFRQDLQARLLGSTAHISLMRMQSDGIKDWRPLLERLSRRDHVIAAAPAIYEQVLVSRGPRATGAVLKGMLPVYEKRVSDLLSSVVIGSAKELEDKAQDRRQEAESTSNQLGNEERTQTDSVDELGGVEQRIGRMPPIILGKDMADNLGATVGSVVLVTSPQGELTPLGVVPKYMRFRVVGIFNSGFYDYDTSWAYTGLRDAQRLFGLGDVISVIEFKIDDIYRAPQIGREIDEAAGHGFMTANWMEQNRALFHALRLERLVTFITIGLIVFVAALNIVISLIMMVMEKTKDIAVLMSMGTRRAQIRRVFMAEGVLIGLFGTGLGLILGYLLSFLGQHYHLVSLNPQVYSINYVPFSPRILDGALVAAIAVGISFMATLYPSWSAARVLPAEALRYE
jgi:lipoprotein-releasing system permease protein